MSSANSLPSQQIVLRPKTADLYEQPRVRLSGLTTGARTLLLFQKDWFLSFGCHNRGFGNKDFKAMTINNGRSVFGEGQPGQSFQEPHRAVITEPPKHDMASMDFNPLARLQEWVAMIALAN
jgi:hypothetical protein